MKQIMQNLSSGQTDLKEAPAPKVRTGCLKIHTAASLISAGTERMLVEFGKASLLDKARKQPERVRMVFEKVKTDGLLTTLDAVRSKLSQPLPLGYCNVGRVVEVGVGAHGFSMGDRVVSNGPHADIVVVPKNLCAKIPDNVDDESAAFAIVASIGLQGIRLAKPMLGEVFAVTGVGLIGLLTVQLLRAQGCRVLAIDFDDRKLALAKHFGAECCNPSTQDAVAAGLAFSRGNGVDGVIITASTASNDPVSQAAKMSRKRGRIVLVGVVGLELNRADFYEKELSFQVSCSYGPGRYDPAYEEQGHDYPYGLVRWTQQRNFEAVLDMMASGQLDIKPLITHRYAFEDAQSAYETLTDDGQALGIILGYDSTAEARECQSVQLRNDVIFDASKPVLGVIGAGNYASRVLLPAFKAAGCQAHSIVTYGGVNGVITGQKNGFAAALTDVEAMLKEPAINTIVVATRHDSHARYAVQALSAGKHVFVEKPLALTMKEVDEVEQAYEHANKSGKPVHLMVGFNRRFAPHVIRMKELLVKITEPKSFVMTINAGAIPVTHWTQDRTTGGGRLIGEACHFIDLMRFLAGHPISSYQVQGMVEATSNPTHDKFSIMLAFADGSFGTIHYLANGAASFPKERIEVFAGGRILQVDNFRTLKGWGWKGFVSTKLWRQDKGQKACAAAFLQAVSNGEQTPIAAAEIFEVARVTLQIDALLAGTCPTN